MDLRGIRWGGSGFAIPALLPLRLSPERFAELTGCMLKNRSALILVLRLLLLLKGTTNDASVLVDSMADPHAVQPSAICMVIKDDAVLAVIPC